MIQTPSSPVEGAAIVALNGRDNVTGALICFSHLRWDFVFQRPQHLMTRFAATRQVIANGLQILGVSAPERM